MPNSYFQFKQFRVEQDRCAMKVCTDSCVFGAYVEVQEAQRILDIGTGTGLLSLMVTQRSHASIDAVEINAEAQLQAQENFAASPWAKQLHLHPMSLQEFARCERPKYDVILSNPPFFLSSLKSPDAARNTAKHTGELLFEDILQFAQSHLKDQGKLCLLLPPPEAAHFAKLAKASDLYLSETLQVFTYHGGKCIRHIQTYTFTPMAMPVIKEFYIREEDKVTYTSAFTELLKSYYLIF
ncbi:methyltransferase [Pontibacter korlensis]|uniref:tRNA1(Val) (adenine(37)-N6)-methyltransferase n=1 Tax=Pontibacter korlensis TaxID=400092 RepID=A0A0E3ZE01_9BACT|nr:methyltransferase [Pontibacter korlensis]AKD03493.1 methyltransferase [Pontibacter korlensis]